MPVGLKFPENLSPVAGVRLASGASGIKTTGATDLLLIDIAVGSAVAGVFTQNAYCAAPVTLAKKHLQLGGIRAMLINSGNANAGTGSQGLTDAIATCGACANHLGIEVPQVLPFSTGVISELLPVDKVTAEVEKLVKQLDADHWLAAAEAIMTTDTMPKAITRCVVIDDQEITITGISKGSGMIHPNMATMLSFVATDACVDEAALQRATTSIANRTFNCITVDGDTSTNDAFMVIATAALNTETLDEQHPQWADFYNALEDVSRHLAHSIIRDGEGATRFIEIQVADGENELVCREVALTIAHSPLVKTAFFAGDPNLGRILAAIGRSRVDALDMNLVSMSLGDLPVVINGEPAPGYREQEAQAIMAKEDVVVKVALGRGESLATVWTTDLSYDYVKINAEYRS